jgi:hypothetical protein
MMSDPLVVGLLRLFMLAIASLVSSQADAHQRCERLVKRLFGPL